MQVESLTIPSVKLFTPTVFRDERGYFVETFSKRAFMEGADIPATDMEFVQDNQSFSVSRGTLRGLHYQAPPFAQGKLVRVLSGSIYDVAVDVRRNSPTYGRWVSAELSSEAANQLWVPPGFLHGFVTLVPNVTVAYKVTAYYDKKSDGGVLWSDPDIGIEWPALDISFVLSEKDANAPRFKDFISPFD